jgi:hypothetical protein
MVLILIKGYINMLKKDRETVFYMLRKRVEN